MHKIYITNLHTKTKRDKKKNKQILEGYRPSLHLNTSFLLLGKTEKKAKKKKKQCSANSPCAPAAATARRLLMTSAAEVASKGRCSCSGAQFVQQIRNPASGKRKIDKKKFLGGKKKKMEPVRSSTPATNTPSSWFAR